MISRQVVDMIKETVTNAVVEKSTKEEVLNSVLEGLEVNWHIMIALQEYRDELEDTMSDLREEIDELKEANGLDTDEFDTGVPEIDELEHDWDLQEDILRDAEELAYEFEVAHNNEQLI